MLIFGFVIDLKTLTGALHHKAMYRHAAGTQGLPDHGNEAYFHTAANFLVECSNKQINLSPEKCKQTVL